MQFIVVPFDIIVLHPIFDISETVSECGVGGGDGFCGDVQLDIINIGVKLQAVVTDNISKWKHVEDEEECIKHHHLEATLR